MLLISQICSSFSEIPPQITFLWDFAHRACIHDENIGQTRCGLKEGSETSGFKCSCGFVLVLSLRIIFLTLQMHFVGVVFFEHCPLTQGENIQAIVYSKLKMSGMLQEFLQRMFQKSEVMCFLFPNQFPHPFSSTEPPESKSAVGILFLISFLTCHPLPKPCTWVCLIRLINYCFGHGPL